MYRCLTSSSHAVSRSHSLISSSRQLVLFMFHWPPIDDVSYACYPTSRPLTPGPADPPDDNVATTMINFTVWPHRLHAAYCYRCRTYVRGLYVCMLHVGHIVVQPRVRKRLNRERARLGCGLMWAQGTMLYYYKCTLAPPGEYNWMICARRQCCFMSNYYDDLLYLLY